jgi:hypothetical protein
VVREPANLKTVKYPLKNHLRLIFYLNILTRLFEFRDGTYITNIFAGLNHTYASHLNQTIRASYLLRAALIGWGEGFRPH